jgi:hypothetical protein
VAFLFATSALPVKGLFGKSVYGLSEHALSQLPSHITDVS